MQHRCKVTVLATKCFTDFQEQYLADPKSGPCPCYYAGDEYFFDRTADKDDFWHTGLNTLVKGSGDPDTTAGGPTGAISIFDKNPDDMPQKPKDGLGPEMAKLVSYRRSCRRFLDKNVDPLIIDQIITAMENAPTGGNSQSVEYTVIDDKERVKEIWSKAYPVMEADAKRHIYTQLH